MFNLTLPLFVSLLLRLAAVFLLSFFVIPKQYKEFKVRNGMKRFRLLLFALGIAIDLLALAQVFSLFAAKNGHMFVTEISLLTGVGIFCTSLLLYLIYRF